MAKTVAGTFVSKRYCNKAGGSKGPPAMRSCCQLEVEGYLISFALQLCPGCVRTLLVEKQISDIASQRSISQKEATKELR